MAIRRGTLPERLRERHLRPEAIPALCVREEIVELHERRMGQPKGSPSSAKVLLNAMEARIEVRFAEVEVGTFSLVDRVIEVARRLHVFVLPQCQSVVAITIVRADLRGKEHVEPVILSHEPVLPLGPDIRLDVRGTKFTVHATILGMEGENVVDHFDHHRPLLVAVAMFVIAVHRDGDRSKLGHGVREVRSRLGEVTDGTGLQEEDEVRIADDLRLIEPPADPLQARAIHDEAPVLLQDLPGQGLHAKGDVLEAVFPPEIDVLASQ